MARLAERDGVELGGDSWGLERPWLEEVDGAESRLGDGARRTAQGPRGAVVDEDKVARNGSDEVRLDAREANAASQLEASDVVDGGTALLGDPVRGRLDEFPRGFLGRTPGVDGFGPDVEHHRDAGGGDEVQGNHVGNWGVGWLVWAGDSDGKRQWWGLEGRRGWFECAILCRRRTLAGVEALSLKRDRESCLIRTRFRYFRRTSHSRRPDSPVMPGTATATVVTAVAVKKHLHFEGYSSHLEAEQNPTHFDGPRKLLRS